ncbi:MAG: heavy-metal-associated domain-containing protein [Verrucomicrobiae bacterium]|nr:heavy-metal-associated domain-containing protein [Verrucomicrobiae bacterium]
MTATELEIEGMDCGSCAFHVQEALKKVRGVRSVRVDLEKERAFVEHEDADFADFHKAVLDAGYAIRASHPAGS